MILVASVAKNDIILIYTVIVIVVTELLLSNMFQPHCLHDSMAVLTF